MKLNAGHSEAEKVLRWLRKSVLAIVVLFPLVIVPGLERPFSTPKIFLLEGFVAVASICAICLGKVRWPSLPTALLFSLAAWGSALIASSLFGEFVSFDALWLSVAVIGWFFLVLTVRPKALHIGIGISISCGVVALIALLQYLGMDPFQLFGLSATLYESPRMRVFGTLGNPNFVAAFLVAGMPLSIALGKILQRPVLFSFVASLDALAVFATGSRAAALALLAVLFWLGLLKKFFDRRALAAGMFVIIAMLAFMQSRPLATTIAGRLYLWRVSASHLFERPLFGYGPGAFEPKYIQWETQYWRDGKGTADERRFAALQEHAHNDYLETLVNNGLAGLFSLFFLFGSFFVSAFRLVRASGGELIAGASAGAAALGAVAMVDFPLHRPTELFVLWTLMAMVCLTSQPSDSGPRD